MSEHLEINGVRYVLVAVAAKKYGYTADYITKLAREKKIFGTKICRRWFVTEESVEEFIAALDNAKFKNSEKVTLERKRAHAAQKLSRKRNAKKTSERLTKGKLQALTQAMVIVVLGLSCGVGGYSVSKNQTALTSHAELGFFEYIAVQLYEFVSQNRYGENTAEEMSLTPTENFADNSEGVAEQHVAPQHAEESVVRQRTSQGILVMPMSSSTSQMEEFESVAESFSDEVSIVLESHDADRGIIVPQFKESEGDEYQFLLVPLPNE